MALLMRRKRMRVGGMLMMVTPVMRMRRTPSMTSRTRTCCAPTMRLDLSRRCCLTLLS